MRARRRETGVSEHLPKGLRFEAVVAGELDALEADLRHVLKRPLETARRNEHLAVLVLAAADVRADGVELEGNLAVDAGAIAAERALAARERGRGDRQAERLEELLA